MLRPLDIVMIGLLLGGAAITFKIKHDSEIAIDHVAKLEEKIKAEQDAIDVLEADWSLLTNPKRLQKLVERYGDQLGVEQAESTAIGKVDEIPIRPPSLPQDGDEGITALIEGSDDTMTGTVSGVQGGGAQ